MSLALPHIVRAYGIMERFIEPIREYRRVPSAFTVLLEECLDPDPAKCPSVAVLTR